MNFQNLLEVMEYGHRYRIRIWCDNNISEALNINFKYCIHNNPLCNYIKSSSAGMKNCVRCRKKAEWLAERKGVYCGLCVHGIYEVVQPVYLNGRIAAVVFITNLVSEESLAYSKLKKRCEEYSLDFNKAQLLLSQAENEFDIEMLKKTAAVISELAEDILKSFLPDGKNDWPELVRQLVAFARNYDTPYTLNDIAKKLGYNEKYLGRIFKKYTGMTFCEYRNGIRMRDAVDLLENSSLKVIDIAAAVGCDNVTYFNKLFRLSYGMTPIEYRKKNKGGKKL